MKVRQLNFAFSFAVSVLLWSLSLEHGIAQEDTAQWPAGVKAKGELSAERSYMNGFSGVDVATLQWWLDAIRLRLPVRLEGKLTGWFWVQQSADSWFDFRNYKVEASIQSPNLRIDQWMVSNAKLRFGYANGNWYVGQLFGTVKSPKVRRDVGTVDLKAKILTASTSDLKFWVDIESVDLHELLLALGIENQIKRSDGQVRLSGMIPLNHAADLTKWEATAEVKVAAVELPWIVSLNAASATFALSKGDWRLSKGRFRVANQDVGVAGHGSLRANFPFEFSADGTEIDIRQLLTQLKATDVARITSGFVQLKSTVRGNQRIGIEHASAAIESDALKLDANLLESLSLTSTYAPDRVKISIDSATFAGGKINGTAEWKNFEHIATRLPTLTKFAIDNVELSQINIPGLPFKLGGAAYGDISITTIENDQSSVLVSSGRVQIVQVIAANSNLGNLDLQWNKAKASKEVAVSLSLQKGAGSLASKVILVLKEQPHLNASGPAFSHYRADGTFNDYQLDIRPYGKDSMNFLARVIGGFNISGTTANLFEKGAITLSRSSMMFSKRELKLEFADATFDEKKFRVDRFSLFDTAGKVSGTATIQRGDTGEHSVNLNVSGFELKPYLEDMVPHSMKTVNGVVDLNVALTKGVANSDWWSDWNGQFKGALAELAFSGKKLGQLNANGTIADQLVVASATGKLLSGETTASAKFPLSLLGTANKSESDRGDFRIDVNGFEARRLAAFLLPMQRAKSFIGSASVQLSANLGEMNALTVDAKLYAPLVKIKRKILARDLVANVKYTGNKILVEKISGGFANGRINIKGQLAVANESFNVESGRLDIAAQRVDVKNVIAFIEPEYVESFGGEVGFRGALSYQRGVNIVGHVGIDNGNVLGIPLQRVNGQARVNFDGKGNFKQVVSNGLYGKAYGGSLEAKLKITGGNAIGLDVNGTVTRGKLEQLGESMGFKKVVGRGSFDGRFDVTSKKIASLKSLEGGVLLKFENGDAQTVPLVSAIDRFVPLVPLASTEIQDGFLNAKLSLGQLRISELKLSGKSFMIAANGDVSLDGTRLDLETIVFTGGNIQQRIAQSAIKKWVAGSVPQLAAAMELNDLLRNRTVFLRIVGSPSRPVIQPKAGETVIRAFLENLSSGLFTQSSPLNSGAVGK